MQKRQIAAAAKHYGVVRKPKQIEIAIDEDLYRDLLGYDHSEPEMSDLDIVNAAF